MTLDWLLIGKIAIRNSRIIRPKYFCIMHHRKVYWFVHTIVFLNNSAGTNVSLLILNWYIFSPDWI